MSWGDTTNNIYQYTYSILFTVTVFLSYLYIALYLLSTFPSKNKASTNKYEHGTKINKTEKN